MRAKTSGKILVAIMLVWLPSATSLAISIDVRFQSETLFGAGVDDAAEATIRAAATDLSTAITSTLGAVNTDTYSGVNGSATVTFNWNANYSHPVTGQEILVPNATLAADTVTVFVGTANLLQSGQGADALGQGGPQIGLDANVTYNPSLPGQWPAAAMSAAAQSEVAYLRGSGPTIGTLSGGGTIGGVTSNYLVDYGAAFGTAWFDVDQDNNGVKDTEASLSNYWHWNHDTAVAPGKNDLYTVALHEFMHVLGIGNSTTWEDLTSGTTWNGAEVIAIEGSGSNLIFADGSHIAGGIMSPRISDGATQEVVMDPNLAPGQRKELTALDLAFLRDIGYETITLTLPADYNGDGDVDAGDLATLENWYGINGNGDADGDGDTDGADFLSWQRQYNPLGAIASVPEPGTFGLLICGLAVLTCRRHR